MADHLKYPYVSEDDAVFHHSVFVPKRIAG